MESEADRVKRIIEREFGRDAQQDALRHLWAAYEEAHSASREFEPAQRRKVYGHHRLALAEKSFKLFSRKHGFTWEDFRPPGETYIYFTMRSSSLVLTIKASRAPNTLPPSCIFRDTLAAGTQFGAFEDVTAVDGRKFFHVLLLHNCRFELVADGKGGYVQKRIYKRPGFVELAVPERDGKECLYRVDLLTAHPETVADLRGHAAEGVSAATQNRPRVRPKTDERQETGVD